MHPETIAAERPKRGRPVRGARSHRIHLRLNDNERAILEERARIFNIDAPTALRLLITGYTPPAGRFDRDAQRHIWRQVRGVAVDVNQIARRASATREELAGVRAEVARLVATLRELAGLEP